MNLVAKENRSLLRADLAVLQECNSRSNFDAASNLWCNKWSIKEPDFTRYFTKQWLKESNRGWYQGFVNGVPDHNNAEEADNRYIKEDQARTRLGLIQFMNHAETTLVQSWSTDRDEESYSYKSFNEAPVLKLSDWTSAWQWSCLCKEIVKFKTDDSKTYFCMPAGEEKTLSRKDCKLYFNRVEQANWTSFDEYAKHVSKINYIEYDKIDWLKSKCSCCYWAKNYFCSHVIGLAVAKKKIAYKDIHKQIPIGQSRSRGQPKKTKGALEKQDDYSSSTDSLDSSPESVASPEQQKAPKKTYVKKRSPKKRGRKPKLNKSL